jgi:ribosomal protein S8
MTCWEVRNAIRRNVVGEIYWENTKVYNDLLLALKKANYIDDVNQYYVMVESYGLAFSVREKQFNSESFYIKLKVEENSSTLETPILNQKVDND